MEEEGDEGPQDELQDQLANGTKIVILGEISVTLCPTMSNTTFRLFASNAMGFTVSKLLTLTVL